jgi:hypothetical protein
VRQRDLNHSQLKPDDDPQGQHDDERDQHCPSGRDPAKASPPPPADGDNHDHDDKRTGEHNDDDEHVLTPDQPAHEGARRHSPRMHPTQRRDPELVR